MVFLLITLLEMEYCISKNRKREVLLLITLLGIEHYISIDRKWKVFWIITITITIRNGVLHQLCIVARWFRPTPVLNVFLTEASPPSVS